MQYQILFKFILTFIMLWSSSTLLAASFNCAKASTAIEKTICANRSLSQMDSSLGKLYSQRLKGLPKAETNQLKQEQREWLAQRNNCSAMDVDCLLSSYKPRIAQLTTEGQNSPSFNCAKASTAIEKAICANRSLSQMDSSLEKLYSQRLKGLPKAETNQLKQEQREWLVQRNNCSAMDVDCLLSSYRRRIAELTTEGQNFPAKEELSEEEFEESPITETPHKQTKSTVQAISPISETVKPTSDKPKPVTETISPPTELPVVESTPKSEKLKPVTEATLPPTKLQPAESTQELDKIDKPIVAMEVKSLSPEEIQAVQEVLKALQKLSAATEVGVNFKEYGTLVIEAKAQTNAALAKLSEGGLKEELEATMDAYMDALRAWNAIIKHKFDSEYDDPELTETLVAKYPILTTIRYDEIEKMVTPVIWHFAGEHLKRTNELFNRSLRKTQSPAEQFKIIVWLLIVIVFLGLYVIWDKLLKNIKLTSFKAKPVGETSQQMIAVNQEGYSSSPIEVIATTIKLQQKQEYLPSIQGVSALQKSGGIIALIAGIFGIIAALVTLLFGGLAGAFKAEGAGMVIGLGWGGILFSFLTIVFAAISMGAKSRTPGVFLILTALLGAVLGGTFVAIFMSLAFIGGILATIGVNKSV